MSRKLTTVISFKIESTFDEWVKIFDSKDAEGNIQKFVQANSEWIKSHKVVFSTMKESWI